MLDTSINPGSLPIVAAPPEVTEESETNVAIPLDQTCTLLPPPLGGTLRSLEHHRSLSTHTGPNESSSALEAPSQAVSDSFPTEPEPDVTCTPIPPGLAPPPLPPLPIVIPISDVIARFKPSPRDIISGIAPHVFDERRRRRPSCASKQGRRSSSPRWFYHQCRPKASPLRRSVVVSWDDHSIYLDESSAYKAGEISNRVAIDHQQSQAVSNSVSSAMSKLPSLTDKSVVNLFNWRKFKLDGHLFKALVSRIKKRDLSSKTS